MSEDFLKPKGVHKGDLSKRRMEDGQFRNPPLMCDWGGFSSVAKGKWENNKMSLESGGPQAVKGRPI